MSGVMKGHGEERAAQEELVLRLLRGEGLDALARERDRPPGRSARGARTSSPLAMRA